MTSNILKVIVFTDKSPTENQKILVNKIRDMDINILVDSEHHDKSYDWWFLKNFKSIPHNLFYNDPYLLSGTVEEISFSTCGPPDFCVYFSQDDILTKEDWKLIYKYFNLKLHGIDEMDAIDFKRIQDVYLKPIEAEFIKGSNEPEMIDDDMVKLTKSENYYYKYESRHIESEDRIIICICRPDNIEENERPFCLIIDEFSKKNYYPLFRQIYCSKDWGGVMDNNFLMNLWKELKLDGTFVIPTDVDPSEGHVFRSTIDDLFKVNEFGKRFYF